MSIERIKTALGPAGWLEGGLTVGCEKLLIDADRLGAYQTLLVGMECSDEDLAADAYAEVPQGSHFLGCGHTLRNYDSAFYAPIVSDWNNYETWEENGEKRAEQRANALYHSIIRDFEAPEMDPQIRTELDRYVESRRAQLSAS